ncbi:MucB/RseB C-terminal domain-containing protein [Halopseudomonas sp.]|uniref:MucB/RseB C-terminal domain-containing protein n=1 Tax=Halopseudomonas sp. TaxID=2901191 RepID=UPI0035645AB6
MPSLTAARLWANNWMAAGVASAALLFAAPVAGDEARELLEKMAVAAREQSYQGDFVYERTGSFSTHRVWRQVDDQVVERLLRTDGAPQEWVRRDGRLECSSALTSGVAWRDSGLLADESFTLHQWYSLQVLGTSRVANRAVSVVAVKPRDPFRYAYELYLDADTGLLLQSLLINEKEALLERFQFTNLEVGPVTPEQLSAVGACPAIGEQAASDTTASAPAAEQRWLPAWLPPGFAPVRRETRRLNGEEMPVVTQAFTDGLARFTVFIEPLAEDRVADDLRAQLGPTVAVSRRLVMRDGAYLATVVGEVPPATAERVAASLAPDFDPGAVIDTAP